MNIIKETSAQYQVLSQYFLDSIYLISEDLEKYQRPLLRLQQIIKQAIVDILDEFPSIKKTKVDQTIPQTIQIKVKAKVQKSSDLQLENMKNQVNTNTKQQYDKIITALQQITLKQPFEQKCFLCQMISKTQLNSKTVEDKQYFYHIECFTKAKYNDISIDQMALQFEKNYCQICNKNGAYYLCENCNEWYHYTCMRDKYKNNQDIVECPCQPIDIFKIQELEEQSQDNQAIGKKKIKIDHISQNTDLFSDISFKKEDKLI